jgi:hypothetical protein
MLNPPVVADAATDGRAMKMTHNDRAERRARRRLGLALYLSRVRSSDLLGGNLNVFHFA